MNMDGFQVFLSAFKVWDCTNCYILAYLREQANVPPQKTLKLNKITVLDNSLFPREGNEYVCIRYV